MGSSGDDYSVPPQQPAPPANLISPMGQSTPDRGWQGINFLDNNTATGITPAMDAQIRAMNGPQAPPGGMPTQTPPQPGGGDGGLTPEMREGLARLMAGAPQKQDPGIGRSNARWVGPGKAGP